MRYDTPFDARHLSSHFETCLKLEIRQASDKCQKFQLIFKRRIICFKYAKMFVHRNGFRLIYTSDSRGRFRINLAH